MRKKSIPQGVPDWPSEASPEEICLAVLDIGVEEFALRGSEIEIDVGRNTKIAILFLRPEGDIQLAGFTVVVDVRYQRGIRIRHADYLWVHSTLHLNQHCLAVRVPVCDFALLWPARASLGSRQPTGNCVH
jgi:hypothetical protein